MAKELKSMMGTSATDYSRDVPVKGKPANMEHHYHKIYINILLVILNLGYKAL